MLNEATRIKTSSKQQMWQVTPKPEERHHQVYSWWCYETTYSRNCSVPLYGRSLILNILVIVPLLYDENAYMVIHCLKCY